MEQLVEKLKELWCRVKKAFKNIWINVKKQYLKFIQIMKNLIHCLLYITGLKRKELERNIITR